MRERANQPTTVSKDQKGEKKSLFWHCSGEREKGGKIIKVWSPGLQEDYVSKVLLIEDEFLSQYTLSKMLKGESHEVVIASSYEEGRKVVTPTLSSSQPG